MTKKTMIIGFILVAVISLILVFSNTADPFDPIEDMRSTLLDSHEVIDIKETEAGTMVYSVGRINNNVDNMYFVDMVKKSLIGYKWLGGGGHINRDVGRNENFIFSSQLLNERQNINPTMFGVFADEKIKDIDVLTPDGTYDAIFYDGRSGEKVYYIPLDNHVSNYMSLILIITYEDNERVDYIISNDEISSFQEGKSIYFY
ncbi:MAG: hypothetical protein APF76_00530 [Desulfitibacter sp. BRH_c19]|nr:MAG: hypothetical protein APF76_00530 [Desulfitibacter sp. BRH_c19]